MPTNVRGNRETVPEAQDTKTPRALAVKRECIRESLDSMWGQSRVGRVKRGKRVKESQLYD